MKVKHLNAAADFVKEYVEIDVTVKAPLTPSEDSRLGRALIDFYYDNERRLGCEHHEFEREFRRWFKITTAVQPSSK